MTGGNGHDDWKPRRSVDSPQAIMSIDVEDWFQVENLKGVISRESWSEREYRVEANTDRILEIFSDTQTTATFFCLGWVAERSPALIRRIHAAGHEVASHGYGHQLVYDLDAAAFREDVVRAKGVLEDLSGAAVLGYRAPSFSITPWALEVLAGTGHRYDSSVFPVSGHDRYAALALDEADRVPRGRYPVAPVYAIGAGTVSPGGSGASDAAGGDPSTILEIPIATLRMGGRGGRTPAAGDAAGQGGRALPWGGGGYFRLIPYPLFAAGFRRGVTAGTAPIFYLHPWEVDSGQPRVEGLRRSYAFRHYVNLAKTAERLRKLCGTVRFGRADRALGFR